MKIHAKCPLIVQCLGAYIAPNNTVHFVLEYMDYGSLQDLRHHLKAYSPDCRVPEIHLKWIASNLIRALRDLHFFQILHRDIKPPNILINKYGDVKLSDFGVSRYVPDGLAHSYVGTHLYMAPESLNTVADKFSHSHANLHTSTSTSSWIEEYEKNEGQSVKEYSYSVDVWSLGVTLCELASGHHPFAAENFFDRMDLILRKDIKIPEHLSKTAADFIKGCLERDCSKRLTIDQLLLHPFTTVDHPSREIFVSWLRGVYGVSHVP